MLPKINKSSMRCYWHHRRNVGENDTFAEASLAENRIDAFRKKGSSSALFHRSVRPCKSLRLRSKDRKISSDKGKIFASSILVPCYRCTILTSNLLARWEPKWHLHQVGRHVWEWQLTIIILIPVGSYLWALLLWIPFMSFCLILYPVVSLIVQTNPNRYSQL